MTDSAEGSYRWMTTTKNRRLHALVQPGWERAVEALIAGEGDPGRLRFACGLRTVVFYPGHADRVGLARCLYCARATGTRPGWGWPANGR